MSNFFKLIYNELIKTYIRKSTWIMYIILAGIIIGLGFLTNSFEETGDKYEQDNWREVLQEENQELTKEMEAEEFMEGMNTGMIAQNNYYLENDIQPSSYDAWQFVMENQLLLSLVSLLTIIVAAGIVANEFRWGTIKLLLIRPISRTKMLLAKYTSVLLFSLFTLLFVLLFSWIIGAIFFGINGMDPHIVMEKSSGLEYISVINEIVSGYGFKLVNLVMMTTFAFMISTIFRNSALAIGTAIFLMMAGNQIVGFFAERTWAKYILFANTDLSQYVNGNTPWIEDMTLGFSITMLLIYYVIFMLLSWVFFAKRDVAGQ
ncbi:ABC transporter permease [Virgibacillus profundi]|uniref:ABC transporter permease n=1 Tax=Virgibacillus profundi TaxID=2024555 RepID=A0A2A2IHP0_9BACI|nr:ABC transporter permease [Virgibacillus profundi]PAV30660.1 ABC transporter permease [Virgibacillus profundi]PXY54832.1 ABC transporter permease [Virgibacillus profundi]